MVSKAEIETALRLLGDGCKYADACGTHTFASGCKSDVCRDTRGFPAICKLETRCERCGCRAHLKRLLAKWVT